MPDPDEPAVAEAVGIKALITSRKSKYRLVAPTVGQRDSQYRCGGLADLCQTLQFSALQPTMIF